MVPVFSASRPVSRVLFQVLQPGDDHLSSHRVATMIEQPTRKSSRAEPTLLPYLALLPMGFAEPTGHPVAGGLLH